MLDGIGEKLREIRKQMDLTQGEFAKKVGVSRVLIVFIETGRRKPSIETVKKLCKFCNINLDEFLEPEEKKIFLYGTQETVVKKQKAKLVIKTKKTIRHPGEKLKNARIRRGYTKNYAATMVRMELHDLGLIERQISKPTDSKLKKLCKLYNINLDEMNYLYSSMAPDMKEHIKENLHLVKIIRNTITAYETLKIEKPIMSVEQIMHVIKQNDAYDKAKQ